MRTSDSQTIPATLEDTLTAWEERLGQLEQQAVSVLRAVKQARRVAAEGAMAGAANALSALREAQARLMEMTAAAVSPPPIDIAAAFEDGSYIKELAAAAAAENVTLVQRDGQISVFPVAMRQDARNQGVRVGRQLERRLRPSVLARQLKTLQQRPGRFNARSFLDRLLRAYAVLTPDWREGEGPLVSLTVLHDVLTLLPAAAADYPLEEFITDLLRLDREPDARSGRGHRFELGGSTGTKGAKRLTVYDEDGGRHDYYAIRFIAETAHV